MVVRDHSEDVEFSFVNHRPMQKSALLRAYHDAAEHTGKHERDHTELTASRHSRREICSIIMQEQQRQTSTDKE